MAPFSRWTASLARPHLRMIALIGLIVPRRIRAEWRQEWESELHYRERLLADWDRLDWRRKLDLVRRSTSAFADALWLQQKRLEADMVQDLRYGARMLLAHRGFTAVAVMSLALGIGANTAIFSLVDAVFLRQLPVERPHELYFVGHDGLQTSSNYPVFERYRETNVFSGFTAYYGRTFRVRRADGVEQVGGQVVSGNYHAVVGVPTALGHAFSSTADRGAPVMEAVISDEYWSTHFGRSAEVIGKTLDVDGRLLSIVGVSAAGFRGLNPAGRVDITVPMSVMALDRPGYFDDHDGWIGQVIVGRLAAGVSEHAALGAVDVIFQRFMEEPANQWARKVNRDSYRAAALMPASRGTRGFRDQYGTPLVVLMAMVGVVLLIACANVANLLLARATARSREIAVRLSIGASRLRLLRQLLTESVLLAMLGGIVGVLLASWGTSAILSLLSIGPSPMTLDAPVNLRVLAFTASIVLVTAIGFGLVPAFRSTRLDLKASDGDRAVTVPGLRGRGLGKPLVVVQVALCVVLLAAAALLMRSFDKLRSFDAGFDRQHLLLADVNAPLSVLRRPDTLGAYLGLLERVQTLPGVRVAALATRTPIDFSSQLRKIDVRGVPWTPGDGVSTNAVTPDYIRTFGIRLIRGRDLTATDHRGAPRVALVSESMARFYFPSSDPIGETLQLGGEKDRTTIIGIVEDVRHEQLRTTEPPRMVYTALAQVGTALDGSANLPSSMTIAVLHSQNNSALTAAVRREVRAASTDLLVPYVRTMEAQIDASLLPEHLLAALSTGFGSVALVLACVGLYGVMSYNVGRQTREIGIRMALGAAPRTVLYAVLRDVFTIAGTGVLAGLLIALAATQPLSAFLFNLSPRDPMTLGATAVLLLAVALVAAWLPARHAAAVDPVRALRSE